MPRPIKKELAPLNIVQDGDEYVLCAEVFGGCGTKNPVHLSACHQCKTILWTNKNRSNERFQFGQEAVFCRPKCGQIWDVQIIAILHTIDSGGDLVRIKVAK